MPDILRADKNQHTYKRVCMDFASDTRLSWEARGVMAYLLSKSDDWRIIPANLINQTSAGRDKVYKILGELQEAGYLARIYERDERGKVKSVTYQLTEKPEVDISPLPALPFPALPFPANPTLPKEEIVPNGDLDLKEMEHGAFAPPPAPAIAPEPTPVAPQPQQPVRPTQQVGSAAPVVEQSRLVEAEVPDPVKVYQQVAGVKKPNQAQRDAIRRRVTSHPELWREACDRFARNGWNVRKVDNLLDAYGKAVDEARKAEAAARAAEEERKRREAEREQPYATLEERRAIRDELRRNWYRTTPAEPRPALMARGRT